MKKNLVVLGAVALTAAAVPALAFENEFHGSYTFAGFISNAYDSGTGPVLLKDNGGTNNFIDQRARLQYIAKASDDLKLVTHFELDSKFGGRTGGKYTNTTDAGGLDADGISIETKNIYLDFNVPAVPVNVRLGIQPWADAYKGTFGIFDGAGAVATGKFGKATATLGGFRFADAFGAATNGGVVDGTDAGKKTVDLVVVDGKFAINKDMTVGANYYALLRDTGAVGGTSNVAEFTNTVGANFAGKFGPAAVDVWAGLQFGDYDEAAGTDLLAYGGGTTAKVQAGPGTASAALLYLSGEKSGSGDHTAWQAVSANTSYFNDANMWILVRNPLSINTSAAIGGNDLTKGGRGLFGGFAGYNGAVNKLLFGANAGYAQINEKQGGPKSQELGIEVNGMIGYKVYDNMTVKFNAAYAFLGNLAKDASSNGGDADNPYVTNVVVQYVF